MKHYLSALKFGSLTFAPALAICGLIASGAHAQTTVNFTGANTPEGTTLANQFSPAFFVIVSPLTGDDSLFYGSTGANLGTWATNTDATITGTDLGAEASSLAGVNQLHAYGNTYPGWLAEDGDGAYLFDFSKALSSISVTFAGDSTGSSGLALLSGGALTNVVHVPVGNNTQLQTATLSGINASNILVVPGSYDDWASVVSITYTFATVPEPSTWAAVLGGAGLLGLSLRRRSLTA